MKVQLGYRQLVAEAMRIGGVDMVRNCVGEYGQSTLRQAAQSIAGPCGVVFDGSYYEMPTIDIPDDPTGLLL